MTFVVSSEEESQCGINSNNRAEGKNKVFGSSRSRAGSCREVSSKPEQQRLQPKVEMKENEGVGLDELMRVESTSLLSHAVLGKKGLNCKFQFKNCFYDRNLSNSKKPSYP